MKQFDTRTKSLIGILLLMVLGLGACAKVSMTPGNIVQVIPKVKTIEEKWPVLVEDGFHDSANPLLKKMQQPREVLSTLPPNDYGNHVNWVTARVEGLINPRRSLEPASAGIEVEVPVMDLDIFLNLWGSQPIVRFPHLAHEQWLHCQNCHEMPVVKEKIFIPQEGSNNIRMEAILSGEFCGVCHSAVAFPISNCYRCHSVDRNSIDGVKARERARLKGRKPNFFSDGRSPLHALPAAAAAR
ncbi:MAG: c(7)-type cytochrome triheme domain-containing protein [Candidatus Nitrotoga sp.]